MESTYNTLKSIFEKSIKDDEITLNEETPLADIFDSLDIIDIIYDVEDKFNIRISDTELTDLKNLVDVANIVEKLIREKHSYDE